MNAVPFYRTDANSTTKKTAWITILLTFTVAVPPPLFHAQLICHAFQIPRLPSGLNLIDSHIKARDRRKSGVRRGSDGSGSGGNSPPQNGRDSLGDDEPHFRSHISLYILLPPEQQPEHSDSYVFDKRNNVHGDQMRNNENTDCCIKATFVSSSLSNQADRAWAIRGGDVSRNSQPNSTETNKKSPIDVFNDALHSMQTNFLIPFQSVGKAVCQCLPPPFKKRDQQTEAQQRQQKLLSTTRIQSVTVPESELLPPSLVTESATQSQLIGGTLTPESLEGTASLINHWYWKNGYVLNSVTGATLIPNLDNDSGGATRSQGDGCVELKVREVKIKNQKRSTPKIGRFNLIRQKPLVTIRFVDPVNGEDDEENIETMSLPIQQEQYQTTQSSGQLQPVQSRVSDRQEQTQQQYRKYKTTTGRTRASKIARILKLAPGSHFQIDQERWSRLVTRPGGALSEMMGDNDTAAGGGGTAIFSSIHAIRPVLFDNNAEGVSSQQNQDTIGLDIIATENKPHVSLEYGVTKSLYSDQWEGELDLKHINTFGGGEIATLNVRRGRGRDRDRSAAARSGYKRHNIKLPSDAEGTEKTETVHSGWRGLKNEWKNGPLSWRMSIKDDYLDGAQAGYDLEVFRDFVGAGGENTGEHIKFGAIETGGGKDPVSNERVSEIDSPRRTGLTARFRFAPPKKRLILPRTISASVERIESPEPGGRESFDNTQTTTSVSMNAGPYFFGNNDSGNYYDERSFWKCLRSLRSELSAKATAGMRWADGHKANTLSTLLRNAREPSDENRAGTLNNALPYAAGTITSQQLLPLFSFNSRGHISRSIQTIDLAMRHAVSASSRHLPGHEAILLGLASRVRGYRYDFQSRSLNPLLLQKRRPEKRSLRSLNGFWRKDPDYKKFRLPIAIANSISGTVELRVPVHPFNRESGSGVIGDISSIFTGTIVLFGDWAVSQIQTQRSTVSELQDDSSVKPFRSSSIGIGYRKVLQGMPLKVDACITEHGEHGIFFGLGRDFSV